MMMRRQDFNQIITQIKQRDPAVDKLSFMKSADEGLDDKMITELAAVLPGSNVKELSFSGIHFDFSAFDTLLQAVCRSGIKDLEITRTTFDDTLTHHLATALPRTNIERLNLSQNNIGPRGGVSLAQALPHCPKLLELLLGKNSVSNAGAKAFADNLPKSNLQTLYLQDNDIGNAGAQNLLQAIGNSKIEYMFIEGVHISENILAEIKAAAQQNRALLMDKALSGSSAPDNVVTEAQAAPAVEKTKKTRVESAAEKTAKHVERIRQQNISPGFEGF